MATQCNGGMCRGNKIAAGAASLAGSAGKAEFDQPGVIKFQPWQLLEAGTGYVPAIIQASSRWLRGDDVSTYHLKVQISYIAGTGCTLVLESSNTPEGPWSEVTSFTEQTDSTWVISSEGAPTGGFTRFVRWHVEGTAPWSICFQLEAIAGTSVASRFGVPKKI